MASMATLAPAFALYAGQRTSKWSASSSRIIANGSPTIRTPLRSRDQGYGKGSPWSTGSSQSCPVPMDRRAARSCSGSRTTASSRAERSGELEPNVGEIKRIYVRPDYRGKGFGHPFVRALIDRARHLGYERLRVDTLPTMQAAIEFYQELGFRPITAFWPHPCGECAILRAQCHRLGLLPPNGIPATAWRR